jgi:hypothetical protein
MVEPLGPLCEQLRRGTRGMHLVGGRVLDLLPRGAGALTALPVSDGEVVLARLDLEETSPYSRPLLTRTDLGRDFWMGDDTGRALVRVGVGGQLHPDVELHLDSPFVEAVPPAEDLDEDHARSLYVRTLRTGDPVYVWGRARVVTDEAMGYRDAPLTVEFCPESVIHVYDEPAFRQLSAWRALPWYRKLSVMVRNR